VYITNINTVHLSSIFFLVSAALISKPCLISFPLEPGVGSEPDTQTRH
jgi:hypothetical protein